MTRDVIRGVKNKKIRFFFLAWFWNVLNILSIPHLSSTIKKYQVIDRNGKRGIRTLGTKKSYNGLAIRRFSPLSHLSPNWKRIITMIHSIKNRKWRLEKSPSLSLFIIFIYPLIIWIYNYIDIYNYLDISMDIDKIDKYFYEQFHLDKLDKVRAQKKRYLQS